MGAWGVCDRFLFFLFFPNSLVCGPNHLGSPQIFRKLFRFWWLLFRLNLGPGNCLPPKYQGKEVVLGLCKEKERLFFKVWFVLNRLSNLHFPAFESTSRLPLILPFAFKRDCLGPHSFRAKNTLGGLALSSRLHSQSTVFEPPEWCQNSAGQNMCPLLPGGPQ